MKIQRPREESYYPSSWDGRCVTPEARSVAARFRFASAFKGCFMENDIGNETKAGYEGLLRLVLFQSSFEKFKALSVGTNEEKICYLEEKYCGKELKAEGAVKISSCLKILKVLEYSAKRKKLQSNIKSFRLEGAGSFLLLAQSIRNSFIHGHLAASSWGQNPVDGANLYQFLSHLIWKIMDEEMGQVMRDYYESSRESEGTG